MPLTKRVLYDSSTYHNEEIFHESTSGAVIPQQDPPTIIDNRNMSNMIGILNQLSVLSIFSLEMFHNLSLLTEDINDRVKIMSLRTNTLISKLPSVEKKVNSLDIEPELVLVNNRAKYLKNRDMLTPSLFIKKTNYSSITSQYKMCRTMPQLWRIETYIKNNDDCFKLYSYPGFFFQEWLRTEMITQEVKQEERKANKLIKKQLKTERRRQREEEREAALYLEQQRISAEEGDDEVEDFGSQDENLQSDDEFRGNNMKRKTLLPKKNKQRQISRDTDDHASSHGGDSTDGEKKKKGKMKKVTAKLANVFGFKKTDDEASETESVLAVKNKKLVSKDHSELASSKDHKDSRENKEKATATTTPAGTSAPKSNALSMLFNNFTAKPNAATSTANAATIATDDAHQSAAQSGMSYKEFKESVGNNALPAASNTDGGAPPPPSGKFQKRPSMTMDSMSLSLLTNKFGPTTSSASAANNDGNNNTAGNGASNITTAQSSQQVTAGSDKDKSGAVSPTPAAAPENNKNPVNLSAYTNAPAEDTTGEGDDMFNFSSLPQMNSRFDRNSKRLKAAAPPTSALVMKIGNNKTLTSKPRPRPSSVMRQPTFEYQHTGDLTMLTNNTMAAKKITKNESPTPSERSSTSSRPSHSNNERLSNISRQSSSSTAHSKGRKGKKSGGGARYGSIEEEDFEEDASLQDMDRNSSFDRRESSVNSDPNISIDANNDEPDDEPEFDEDEPPPEDDPEFDDEFSDSPAKTTPKPPAPGAPRPPPPGPPGAGAGAPPPPPPPSLLLIKKVAPPPPPQPVEEEKVDTTRVNLLDAIRNANRNSTVNSAPSKHMSIDQQLIESKKLKVSTVKQNEAVAAILANRSKIAGDSDSDSDDSDSDYTDDGY